VSSSVDEVGEDGTRLVVRNAHTRERRVTVGSGTVPIRAPRVNDKRVDEETGSVSGSARGSCRRTRGGRRR
jgi:putative transposase